MLGRNQFAAVALKRAFVVSVTMLIGLGQLSGCREIADAEIASSITTMRLTVGTQVVQVNRIGGVTGGPIVIPADSAVTYTAELFDNDGERLPHPSSYRLEVKSDNENTLVVQEGGFTGSLRGVRSGATTLQFTLWIRTRDSGCGVNYREEDDFKADVPADVVD